MRHRITFERRSDGSDANGGPLTNWLPVETMWASIETLSGRELLAAQALNAEISLQIVVRYRAFLRRPTAVVSMRIRFTDRIFDIHHSTNTGERNFEVVILVSEGLTQG